MNQTKNCERCGKSFEKNPNVSRRMWNKAKFCSRSCVHQGRPSWNRGLPKTWESPGDFKKGQIPWNKGNGDYAKKLGFGKWMTGRKAELNGAWKGEEVGYGALHDWVRRELGAPDRCTHCGRPSKYPQGMHWANVDHKYRRNLNDWIRLCAKCHKKYDKQFKT